MLKSERGFTVVEMVVASSILFVVLMGVVSAVIYSTQSMQMAKHRDEATSLGNNEIEMARNLPYDSVGVVGGNPAGTIVASKQQGVYQIDTAIEWTRDTSNGKRMDKKVTVTVSWAAPMGSQVTMSTNIFGKSTLANIGDFEIRARYLAGGTPADGIGFSVAGVGDTTDSEGIAFFGALPIGTYDVGVTPPGGYVYSPTVTSGKTVVADSLTTIIVIFERPSEAVYTVTDSSTGLALSGATLELLDSDGHAVATKTSDGNPVTFSGLMIGTYTLNFGKTGYRSSSQPLVVTTEGSTQTSALTLSPQPTTGSIAVTVLDDDGANLNHAKVILESSTGTETTQYTASNGVTTFTDLAPGAYTVTVSYSGYTTRIFAVTLVAGDGLALTVNMSYTSTGTGKMSITTTKKGVKTGYIRVIISGPGYFNDTLRSDWSGNLTTRNLPEGSYTVQTYYNPSSVATVLITAYQTSYVSVDQKQ